MQLIRRHPHGLDDLHQHLREAEVVAAHHLAQLPLTEGGEGLREVLVHHVLPVWEETEGEPANDAREPIKRRERYTCQKARPPYRALDRGRGGGGAAVVSANLGEHSAAILPDAGAAASWRAPAAPSARGQTSARASARCRQ